MSLYPALSLLLSLFLNIFLNFFAEHNSFMTILNMKRIRHEETPKHVKLRILSEVYTRSFKRECHDLFELPSINQDQLKHEKSSPAFLLPSLFLNITLNLHVLTKT